MRCLRHRRFRRRLMEDVITDLAVGSPARSIARYNRYVHASRKLKSKKSLRPSVVVTDCSSSDDRARGAADTWRSIHRDWPL